MKVHKIICSTHTKISTPAIFFDQHQTFVAPHDPHDRGSRSQKFFKIGILRNVAKFTVKHMCWSLFFMKLQAWRTATLKKETPTQVFSCKIREISKNTYFYRTPPVAASDTTHATHAIYHTRRINVIRKYSGLTTAELHHRYFPWELVLDAISKVILKDEKHFQNWQWSQKYCRNWCHIHFFTTICRDTAWLEYSEAVAAKDSMK